MIQRERMIISPNDDQALLEQVGRILNELSFQSKIRLILPVYLSSLYITESIKYTRRPIEGRDIFSFVYAIKTSFSDLKTLP